MSCGCEHQSVPAILLITPPKTGSINPSVGHTVSDISVSIQQGIFVDNKWLSCAGIISVSVGSGLALL